MKMQWSKLDFTAFKNPLVGSLTNGRLAGLGVRLWLALLQIGFD